MPAARAAPPASERFAVLRFVRAPVPELPAPRPAGAGADARAFVRLWLSCLATVLLTAPFALIGAEVSGVGNRVDEVPLAELAILAVVVAPVVEETAFRLALAPFRVGWVVLAGAALGFLLAPWGALVLVAALAVALAPGLRRRAERAWAGRFPLLFWGSAVLFGLVHTFNWEFGDLGWRAVALVPLLVLPQTGLGLVLGAARVRLGYGGAILLHATYNATILSLTLL